MPRADLADLTSRRVRPALEGGAVVVCEGFVDATIVAHRAAGVEEQRFARVAQWAVNGLKADLTVLVDGTSDSRCEESGATAAEPRPQPPVAADGQPTGDAAGEDAAGVAAGRAGEAGPPARRRRDGAVSPATAMDDADDDDEPVLPVQAYRDRASYTPERYLLVRPLSEEGGVINPEVVERITSVLRQRSPVAWPSRNRRPDPAGRCTPRASGQQVGQRHLRVGERGEVHRSCRPAPPSPGPRCPP